ncbi:MAG: ester cyclase [Acidimicrobiia bacterium]
MDSALRTKRINAVRAVIERGFNAGEMVGAEVCDETFVNHVCVYGVPMGGEAVDEHVRMIRTAYPDIDICVTDIVASDDTVAVLWVSRGTASGSYMGLEATGRPFFTTQIAFYRFASDRLIEWTGTFDSLAILRAVLGRVEPTPFVSLDPRPEPWSAATARPQPTGPTPQSDIAVAIASGFGGGDFPSAVDADTVLHVAGREPQRGREPFAARMRELAADFGPLTIAPVTVLEDGALVAVRWRVDGRHLGKHLGLRPTGRPVTMFPSAIVRFDGDRVVSFQEIFDDTSFVDQTKTQHLLTQTEL